MRWLWRGFVAFAGVLLLAIGGLKILDWNTRANVERFYAGRPMLNAIHIAPTKEPRGGKPWPQMTEVLLQYIPTGSSRNQAQQILLNEKLDCSPFNARTRTLSCAADTKPSGVPTYHIEVQFDDTDRVVGGQVLALK